MKRLWHDWRMRRALLRYEEGELASAQAQKLEQHLAVCAVCRRKLREGEDTERSLRQHIPVRNALAPQDAQSMFRSVRVKVESQARRDRLTVRRRMVGALAGACACIGIWMAHEKLAPRNLSVDSVMKVAVATPSPSRNPTIVTPHFAKFSTAPRKLDSPRNIAATTRTGFRRRHVPLYKHRRHELRIVTARRSFAPDRAIAGAGSLVENTDGRTIGAAPASSEYLSLLAQQMRGIGEDSHLLVTVTNDAEEQATTKTTGEAESGDDPNLSLPMKSLSSNDHAPGVATVSTLRVDDSGTQIWRVCSVAENTNGITTMRCAAAWQNGRQSVSSLAVTMEIVLGENK